MPVTQVSLSGTFSGLSSASIISSVPKPYLKSMDNLLLRALARVIQADDGGFAVNRNGRKLYDKEGIQAGEKDLQRLRDIKTKSAGNEFKAVQLAIQMAKSITDSDKALRRSDAAKQIFKNALGKKLVKIFEDRANEIDN